MSRRTETAYKAVIRASQHYMMKSHGFRRNGKCCGCVATVHVLIRGDLSHMPLLLDGAATGNSCRDGTGVSRSHSRRRTLPPAIWQLETSRGRTPEALPRRRAERSVYWWHFLSCIRKMLGNYLFTGIQHNFQDIPIHDLKF